MGEGCVERKVEISAQDTKKLLFSTACTLYYSLTFNRGYKQSTFYLDIKRLEVDLASDEIPHDDGVIKLWPPGVVDYWRRPATEKTPFLWSIITLKVLMDGDDTYRDEVLSDLSMEEQEISSFKEAAQRIYEGFVTKEVSEEEAIQAMKTQLSVLDKAVNKLEG